jgi:hypothetical protein
MSLTLPGQRPIFANNLSLLEMSGQQTYIVRLLRHVGSSLVGPGAELVRTRLGKVVQRISRADDLPGALETLYAVEGFDAVALRLMWVAQRPVLSSDALEPDVMDYEVRQMTWILRPSPEADRVALPPAAERPLDDFYEALHRFGKGVDGQRRSVPVSGDDEGEHTDRLYGLLNDCAALEMAAARAGNETAVRFCTAFSRFTHYAIDEHHGSDERVQNVLESANMTLQTVLASCTLEEDDALQNMITLLNEPRRLLE